jgi:hypothetical protein
MEWLALRYCVPAQPSRSRVYVWRHLRAVQAQIISPGFAVLPDTPDNRRAFERLVDDVRRVEGEAFLICFDFLDEKDELATRGRFADAAHEEETALLKRCAALVDKLSAEDGPVGSARASAVRELASSLDRFDKSPLRPFSKRETGELTHAAGEIFGTLRSLPAEVAALLRTVK